MKVRIQFGGVDEVVEARDANEMLKMARAEAAKRAPFLLRGVVRAMSDQQFLAEAVKRANATTGDNDPAPQTAQEFLEWGEKRGYVTILEA